MREAIYSEEYKGHIINIFVDDDAQSPDKREDDEIFLVGFHRQFFVERPGFNQNVCSAIFYGGKDEDDTPNYEAQEIMKVYHTFNLEAYIHSEVSLAIANEGSFPDRKWDVSLVGMVFVKKKIARTRAKAKKYAEGLIREWNNYLSGNVYGYVIDEDGDSCWGFYGDYKPRGEDSYIMEEAKSAIDWQVKEAVRKHEKEVKAYIRNSVPLSARKPLIV